MVAKHPREDSTLSASTTQRSTVCSIDEHKYKAAHLREERPLSPSISQASTASTIYSIDEEKFLGWHVREESTLSASTTQTSTASTLYSIDQEKLKDKETALSVSESASQHKQDGESEYPEGDLQAWLVVFGSWCALFAALGIMNTMGSYEQYITTHQLEDYTPSEVGWIFSMYAFLTFGGGIVIGPAFDKYGPRWLVLSGSFGVSTSMLLLGNCQGKLRSAVNHSDDFKPEGKY